MVPGLVCGREPHLRVRVYRTTGKGCRRKHIAAVEHALLISPGDALGRKVDVREQDLARPDCREKYSRDGWYHGKHEKRQRYMCVTCKRWVRDNLGFECRQVPRLYITTLALMLSGMVMAAANIRMTLKYLRVRVHVDAITSTPEHHTRAVGEHAKTLKPP